jgi:hypothetical protein
MTSWRDVIKVHPAADDFPLMAETDPEGFRALVDDIKAHGLKTDIVLWSATDEDDDPVYLLDGRNRLDAMTAAGLLRLRKDDDNYGCLAEQPSCKGHIRVVEGADPYALVFSLNIHRRHLTAEQKRELIAKLLEADPNKSDRQIGRIIKADNKTVASVRAEKEAREELPHVETRTDSKGRKQPARRATPQRAGAGRHKCWQCEKWGTLGELERHEFADFCETDAWLHPACVAAFKLSLTKPEAVAGDDIGHAVSTGEAERKDALIEQLQDEKRQLEIKIRGYESEIAELKAELRKLAPPPGEMPDIPKYLRRSAS